jgi:hypothetical protein
LQPPFCGKSRETFHTRAGVRRLAIDRVECYFNTDAADRCGKREKHSSPLGFAGSSQEVGFSWKTSDFCARIAIAFWKPTHRFPV